MKLGRIVALALARVVRPNLVLRISILVVIALFASALELSMQLQEVITISWRASAKAPHLGPAGWATPAIEIAISSILFIAYGYWMAGRYGGALQKPQAQIVMIVASAVFAVLGLVVYSRTVPASEARLDELGSRAFMALFTYVPEILAQAFALWGIGGAIRDVRQGSPGLGA